MKKLYPSFFSQLGIFLFCLLVLLLLAILWPSGSGIVMVGRILLCVWLFVLLNMLLPGLNYLYVDGDRLVLRAGLLSRTFPAARFKRCDVSDLAIRMASSGIISAGRPYVRGHKSADDLMFLRLYGQGLDEMVALLRSWLTQPVPGR